MKKNSVQTRVIDRISRRDYLPLLRGMFVSPASQGRKIKTVEQQAAYAPGSEEELFLTADKGYFLGE